jgi:uncharacterized SAM-binding protein YcdF (DUF218 family)
LQYLSKRTKFIYALCLLVLTPALSLLLLYGHVVSYGLVNDARKADVIIVLGAAVWPNGPSPALRARVWRGSQLHLEGRAANLIFSGGLGLHPPTEAEAMAVLARSWQVEHHSIHLEARATNTRENMAFAAEIMRENGWQSALIVTDYFHMKRAVLLARDYGIEPLRAPVSVEMSYYSARERLKYTLRECAALGHYFTQKIFNRLGGYFFLKFDILWIKRV